LNQRSQWPLIFSTVLLHKLMTIKVLTNKNI
jgi:hypothetical protein